MVQGVVVINFYFSMLHNYHPTSGLDGLGQSNVTPGNVTTAIGAGIASSAPLAGALAPVVALVGGLVALSGQVLNMFGVGIPDMKKIQASNDANDIESQMAQVKSWWDGVEHNTANQQAAVTAWYQLWDRLVQLCSDGSLGSAGQNCIKDRQRGGKWDWFSMHLDPIINTTLTDSGTVSGEVTSMFGSSNGLLIIGGMLVAIGLVASSD